jgi:hypothetical protein
MEVGTFWLETGLGNFSRKGRIIVKSLILLIATLCSTAPLLAGGGTVKVTKIDFVVMRQYQDRNSLRSQDVLTKTLYIASDGRELTDTDDPQLGSHTMEIYDPSTKVTSFLDMKKRTVYTMQEGAFPGEITKGKDIGHKMIQGLECHGFANVSAAGSIEHWWCTDPSSGASFPGALTFRTPDGKQWGEAMQKVTSGVSVTDTFFDVSKDFLPVEFKP